MKGKKSLVDMSFKQILANFLLKEIMGSRCEAKLVPPDLQAGVSTTRSVRRTQQIRIWMDPISAC